jgi:hypothetical protein
MMPEILKNLLNYDLGAEDTHGLKLHKRGLLSYHWRLMTISNSTEKSRGMLNTVYSDIVILQLQNRQIRILYLRRFCRLARFFMTLGSDVQNIQRGGPEHTGWQQRLRIALQKM